MPPVQPVAISKEVCERDLSAGAILDNAASETSCTERHQGAESDLNLAGSLIKPNESVDTHTQTSDGADARQSTTALRCGEQSK